MYRTQNYINPETDHGGCDDLDRSDGGFTEGSPLRHLSQNSSVHRFAGTGKRASGHLSNFMINSLVCRLTPLVVDYAQAFEIVLNVRLVILRWIDGWLIGLTADW